jgi:hypothetical protein
MPGGSGFEGTGGLGEGARHWSAKGPKGIAKKLGVSVSVSPNVKVKVTMIVFVRL